MKPSNKNQVVGTRVHIFKKIKLYPLKVWVFYGVTEIILDCSCAYSSLFILKFQKLKLEISEKHNIPQTQKSPGVPNI